MSDPLSHALQGWQNFFLLAGGAAATLAGLMFLAISLGSRAMTPQTIPAPQVFVRPTLIHFIYVLVTSSVILIPVVTQRQLGILLLLAGLISVARTLATFPFMGRQYQEQKIDKHDWAWYLLVPLASYILYVAAGMGLLTGVGQATIALAVASILLLLTGIRNAWDMVVSTALTQRESPKRETGTESLDQGDGRAAAERQVDSMAQPPIGRDDRPTSLALPPSYQAEVARIIHEAGLDPSDFTWAVQPSRYALIGPLVSALVHAPTGCYFRFEFAESAVGQNRISVFIPGEGAREVTKAAASWEDQLGQVRAWLEHLAGARK